MAGDITTLPAGTTPGSALDGQPITQFDVFQFPCEYHELDGEQRDHVHEYPHRDAGAPEKLGRKLYVLQVRGLFHANMPQFPNLYPNTIDQIQQLFEQGKTSTVVHPSVGSFPGYIRFWKRRRDARVRSGETADIVFAEDQQTQFLAGNFAGETSFNTIASSAEDLAQQLAQVQADNSLLLDVPTLNLFSAIQTVANDISGVSDTAQMYGNLVGARAQQLVNLCAQVDASLALQDARSYTLVESLHEMWARAQTVQQDTQAKRQKLQTWTVPTTMPLTQIATRLYGDAARADDLLALNGNVVPDSLSVKAGTTILYYPAS